MIQWIARIIIKSEDQSYGHAYLTPVEYSDNKPDVDFESLKSIIKFLKLNRPEIKDIALLITKEESGSPFKKVTYGIPKIEFDINYPFDDIFRIIKAGLEKKSSDKQSKKLLVSVNGHQVALINDRIQIIFSSKPDDNTRRAIKNEDFKFNALSKRWYGEKIPAGKNPDPEFIMYLKTVLEEVKNE